MSELEGQLQFREKECYDLRAQREQEKLKYKAKKKKLKEELEVAKE